jgi:integrase/recombinase XerC
MVARSDVEGGAGLRLVAGLGLLQPAEQVFDAMLAGWSQQQLARNLAVSTVESRVALVRAFAAEMQAFPWSWTPQLADEWFADRRAVRHLARSTIRTQQVALRGFCAYVSDPAYGWAAECLERFDTHPIQIISEVNAAAHVADYEGRPGKRAFTRDELQALFDHADEQVDLKRARGRKGWLTAFRDATLFKVAYGFGLRRTETCMLAASDFGPNAHAPEFGDFGVCYVHGKAQRGSEPKQRSVLTVWDWVPHVLGQWLEEALPLFTTTTTTIVTTATATATATSSGSSAAGAVVLWPSERGRRVSPGLLDHRMADYRAALDLDPLLDFHSLRRAYVTHLIEDGWDPRFVQEQVGHEHASTTSIYTCVSSDFRTRTLRTTLDGLLAQALSQVPVQAPRPGS